MDGRRDVTGLGLTVARFFELISDEDARQFVEPRVLSVLDAIFGGGIGEKICDVSDGRLSTLIWFSTIKEAGNWY